jgi:uncharacterized membrane-anchored protein YjiN (DUF445 family)
VIDLVARQAPAWSPEFVDRAVAARIYSRAGPGLGRGQGPAEHAIRQALDRLLARFADDLSNDPATIERASGVLESLQAQPEVRRAFGDVISAGRRLLLEMVDDPDGELRTRLDRRARRPRRPAGHRRGRRARVTRSSPTRPATWSPTTGTS